MNRIIIISIYTLFMVTAARGQGVGIGTNQPDASAALEVSSTNKGLLIPRVDMATSPITSPAAGLMVFNTNSSYAGGTGLYINMGTAAAPQWMQLVPSTSGNFIRNQTSAQTNSNYNISGNGVIGNSLQVGTNYSGLGQALTVTSNNSDHTSMEIKNTSTNNGLMFRALGADFGSYAGAFAFINIISGRTPFFIKEGNVAINKFSMPTATLDVNGDIKSAASITSGGNIAASGNISATKFMVDMVYKRQDHSLSGNHRTHMIVSCPPGYQVISGGGGHRDYNNAAGDIKLSYNGPNPESPSTSWRIIAHNSSGSSRAVVIYCNCAKVQ